MGPFKSPLGVDKPVPTCPPKPNENPPGVKPVLKFDSFGVNPVLRDPN